MARSNRIDANQLIAYNIRRARMLRGWTQEEAADHLAPHIGGIVWSKAVWSAAERSFDTPRVRQFDAAEILGLARAFDLPIGWFFVPPVRDVRIGLARKPEGERRPSEHLKVKEMLDRIVGIEALSAFIDRLDEDGLLQLHYELSADAAYSHFLNLFAGRAVAQVGARAESAREVLEDLLQTMKIAEREMRETYARHARKNKGGSHGK